jgi:arginyl-tRNA synthetase
MVNVPKESDSKKDDSKVQGKKMSSREGTVVYFSTTMNSIYEYFANLLKERKLAANSKSVEEHLSSNKYLSITDEEKIRALSSASYKYGMLNNNSVNDIIFNTKIWCNHKSDSGAYVQMTVAKANTMLNHKDIHPDFKDSKFKKMEIEIQDYSKLDLIQDSNLLVIVNKFWDILGDISKDYNVSTLCKYLNELCLEFCSWYENVPMLRMEQDLSKLKIRMKLVNCVIEIIKVSLSCLDVPILESI